MPRDPRHAYNTAWRKAHPELVRAQQKRSYERHAEKRRAYRKKYATENREKCLAAMKKWADEHPDYRRKYRAEWYVKNRDKQIAYHKKRTRSIRMEVLLVYGAFCSCCGEQDWEFLTIDHEDGGGTKHRDEIKMFGTNFYFWLKKNNFPPGYRTLCFNCNCVMGSLGYCPHRIGARAAKYEAIVAELKLAALAKGTKK